MPCAVILTAITEEYMAVRAHLTDLQKETHPTTQTIYERGKFFSNGHLWEVGIVEIGAGNANAAVEVERAITYFKPVVVYFVGVAGGLKDVALGDVVAATKVYGYESGKVIDTTFLPRPSVRMVSYRLEQIARFEAKQGDWLKRIKDDNDKGSSQLKVFVGAIAAGDKVVTSTNSDIYRLLQSNYGDALAVEMESHGVLSSLRAYPEINALIIRGISDLINNKSDADAKGSQKIASRHASAFAFEVLAKFTLEESIPEEEIVVETGEQEYPTRNINCPVALTTTVVMRIENLQSIGKLLRKSENDLKTQIKNKIQESISRIMTGIEPERFFMRFDSFDAQIRGETKSVEKILSDAIEQQLKEYFQAVVISITLKIVDTDLIKLFRDLQGRNSDFEIEFQPTSGDIEKVKFIGKFQVLSVGENDWNKFQTKFRAALTKREELLKVIAELEEQRMQLERQTVVNGKEITALKERIEAREAEACGINLIRKAIESDLQQIVRRLQGNSFSNLSIQDLNYLENVLNNWLKQDRGSIRDLYGLEVEVSQIDCLVTKTQEVKEEENIDNATSTQTKSTKSTSPTPPKPGLSRLKAQLRDKQDQLRRKEDQLKILEKDIDKIERRRNAASITEKHQYEARLEDLRHERDKLVQEKYQLHDEIEEIDEKIRNH